MKGYLIFGLVLLIFGCIGQATPLDEGSGEAGEGGAEIGALTIQAIANHNTADDCWLVFDGKVYDVTEYIASHPGADAIVEGCGTDAMVLFETRPMGSGTPHSEMAREIREGYYIGNIE